jgi:hypothetical protein
MLGQVAPYIGQFFSAEYVQKQILRMTDEDIEQMKTQMSQEQPPQQSLDGNEENPSAEEE